MERLEGTEDWDLGLDSLFIGPVNPHTPPSSIMDTPLGETPPRRPSFPPSPPGIPLNSDESPRTHFTFSELAVGWMGIQPMGAPSGGPLDSAPPRERPMGAPSGGPDTVVPLIGAPSGGPDSRTHGAPGTSMQHTEIQADRQVQDNPWWTGPTVKDNWFASAFRVLDISEKEHQHQPEIEATKRRRAASAAATPVPPSSTAETEALLPLQQRDNSTTDQILTARSLSSAADSEPPLPEEAEQDETSQEEDQPLDESSYQNVGDTMGKGGWMIRWRETFPLVPFPESRIRSPIWLHSQ